MSREQPDPVPGWDKFMHPNVDWVSEPEYDRAFDELTGSTEMKRTEAAYTSPMGMPYPAFVNIATVGEAGVQITVRGASEDGRKSGPLARMVIHIDEWHQLLADTARLTFPGSGGDTAAARVFTDPDEAVDTAINAARAAHGNTDRAEDDAHRQDPREQAVAFTRADLGKAQIMTAGDPLGMRSEGDDVAESGDTDGDAEVASTFVMPNKHEDPRLRTVPAELDATDGA